MPIEPEAVLFFPRESVEAVAVHSAVPYKGVLRNVLSVPQRGTDRSGKLYAVCVLYLGLEGKAVVKLVEK